VFQTVIELYYLFFMVLCCTVTPQKY
ncbi:hypothetical protein VN97_g1269, partial [Penicillium thymicola]